MVPVRFPYQHHPVQAGKVGIVTRGEPNDRMEWRRVVMFAELNGPRSPWAAAATRALNAAAPIATALPRKPTSIVDLCSGREPQDNRILPCLNVPGLRVAS